MEKVSVIYEKWEAWEHCVEASNAIGWSYYRLRMYDKALDIYYAKTADQSNVNLWENNGHNAQKFKLLDAGNGYIKILSALGDNLYLGISDDDKNVVLRKGEKGDRTLFRLKKKY